MTFCEICGVELLLVLLSAIAYMGIGMIWFGPLLGKPWMKELKIIPNQADEDRKDMKKVLMVGFINALVMSFIFGLVLNYTIIKSVLGGMLMGALIWGGFVSTTLMLGVLWEKKSMKMYWLDGGYLLVSLMVMGAILSL